ncbi:hypothetical protein FACS1894202_00680 [Clostridia bacterium]|nr:hypothetical protein FACS1894202_00680 [Clostridia bacterium]
MRNLKKVLALAVVFAMVLSLGFTSVAATTDASNVGKLPFADGGNLSPEYKTAAELLVNLGIVQGTPKGGELYGNWDQQFTRAELAGLFAQVIDRTHSMYKTYIPTEYTFEDVNADTYAWAVGPVYFLKSLGLIKGVNAEGTKFNPAGIVSAREVVTLALRALGYEIIRDAQFTGPSGTYFTAVQASENKLLLGVDTSKVNIGNWTTPITREESFQILYRALLAKTTVASQLNNNPTGDWFYAASNDTLLKTLYDGYDEITGVLVDNKYAAIPFLNGTTGTNTDDIRLDLKNSDGTRKGEVAIIKNPGFIADAGTAFDNPYNLGRTYRLFTYHENDGKYTIIAAEAGAEAISFPAYKFGEAQQDTVNRLGALLGNEAKVSNIVDNYSLASTTSISTGNGFNVDGDIYKLDNYGWGWDALFGLYRAPFEGHAYAGTAKGTYDYVFRDTYKQSTVSTSKTGNASGDNTDYIVLGVGEAGATAKDQNTNIGKAYLANGAIAKDDIAEVLLTSAGLPVVIRKIEPVKAAQTSQLNGKYTLDNGTTVYLTNPNTTGWDDAVKIVKTAVDAFRTDKANYYVFGENIVNVLPITVNTTSKVGIVLNGVKAKTVEGTDKDELGKPKPGAATYTLPKVQILFTDGTSGIYELSKLESVSFSTTANSTTISVPGDGIDRASAVYDVTIGAGDKVELKAKTGTSSRNAVIPAGGGVLGDLTNNYALKSDAAIFVFNTDAEIATHTPSVSIGKPAIALVGSAKSFYVLDTNNNVAYGVLIKSVPTPSAASYGIVKSVKVSENKGVFSLVTIELINIKDGKTDVVEYTEKDGTDESAVKTALPIGAYAKYDNKTSKPVKQASVDIKTNGTYSGGWVYDGTITPASNTSLAVDTVYHAWVSLNSDGTLRVYPAVKPDVSDHGNGYDFPGFYHQTGLKIVTAIENGTVVVTTKGLSDFSAFKDLTYAINQGTLNGGELDTNGTLAEVYFKLNNVDGTLAWIYFASEKKIEWNNARWTVAS